MLGTRLYSTNNGATWTQFNFGTKSINQCALYDRGGR